MAAEENKAIKEIADKIDSLAKELADARKELDKLKGIDSDLQEIIKIDKKFDDLATSKDVEELGTKLNEFEEDIKEIKDAKETEVIIKKIDDILIAMTDTDTIGKKLDDLQGYIAGLSGIEEKVEELTTQFSETNEIVGIIVRQLDDIERKYNQSIDKLNETAELVEKIAADGSGDEESTKSTTKKPAKTKEEPEKEKPVISKASLPSTIDTLMNKLIELVNPQTEAKEMAEALEEVRDELTPMITVHTPVFFQFGKKARELKSYPPTATLNENDIASLNKDIKSWASKLKEIAKSS